MKKPTPDKFKNLGKNSVLYIIGCGFVGLLVMLVLFNMSSPQPNHKKKKDINYSKGQPTFLRMKANKDEKEPTTTKPKKKPPAPQKLFGESYLAQLKGTDEPSKKQSDDKKVIVKRVPARPSTPQQPDKKKKGLTDEAKLSPITFSAGNSRHRRATKKSTPLAKKYIAKANRLKASMSSTQSQQAFRGFQHSQGHEISSHFKVPDTPYTLLEGTLIPATLVTGINSDLPGDIIAIVNRNVYDSVHQKYLLIPKGSKLIGSYNHQLVLGQHKLLMSWDRLIFPDGRSLSLPDLNSYDLQGRSGISGKVNKHFWDIFGRSALLSLIGAGTAVATQGNSYGRWGGRSAGDVVGRRIAQQFNKVSNKVLSKNIGRQPTITIDGGTQFNVFLAGDISFKHPYKYSPVTK